VLARQLAAAREILRRAPQAAEPAPALSPAFERIRWFPLPGAPA
jgi:hypothetical protein